MHAEQGGLERAHAALERILTLAHGIGDMETVAQAEHVSGHVVGAPSAADADAASQMVWGGSPAMRNYCGKPIRRMRFLNRGSVRIRSSLGSGRIQLFIDRSEYAFSNHCNACSRSPRPS